MCRTLPRSKSYLYILPKHLSGSRSDKYLSIPSMSEIATFQSGRASPLHHAYPGHVSSRQSLLVFVSFRTRHNQPRFFFNESRLAELPGQLKAFRIQDVAWPQWLIFQAFQSPQRLKNGGATVK